MRARRAALLGLASAVAVLGLPTQAMPLPHDHLAALAGDYFAIDSRETDHRYHIHIRLPEGYDEAPTKRFPIVYLLDGDSLFPALAPTHLFLHYDDKLPDAIVVGIAYGSFDSPQNRRQVDFDTGAEPFSHFLSRELVPAVERRVRADPSRRILFGQSRGGDYVLYDAYNQPDLFWARIASNPTLTTKLRPNPLPAKRTDLQLWVSSGSRDRPAFRQRALDWFSSWEGRSGAPWKLQRVTVEGGTHAADFARVYRAAMRYLFAVPAR